MRNLPKLKKQNKTNKQMTPQLFVYKIFLDYKKKINIFEDEEKDYFKPVIIGNFWNNNYIKYKSNDDRKTLSVKNVLIKLDHTYKI